MGWMIGHCGQLLFAAVLMSSNHHLRGIRGNFHSETFSVGKFRSFHGERARKWSFMARATQGPCVKRLSQFGNRSQWGQSRKLSFVSNIDSKTIDLKLKR